MSRDRYLIDAGPLVAVMLPREHHHAACVETLKSLPTPLHTTWPVLTEAIYLTRSDRSARRRIVDLVRAGVVVVEPLDEAFLDWFDDFGETYDDRAVELADASLVYVAGRLDTASIFTIDRRDFSTYRTAGGGSFRIVPGS